MRRLGCGPAYACSRRSSLPARCHSWRSGLRRRSALPRPPFFSAGGVGFAWAAVAFGDASLSRTRRYDVGFYAPLGTQRLAGVADTGGAETQVMLLSRALAECGLSVCVLVAEVPGIDVPASDHGVDSVVWSPAGGGLRGHLREVVTVGAALRKLDADVVIARCAGYWIGLAGLWAKLLRRRFVFASASLIDFNYAAGLAKRRERLLFRLGVALADTIVVQTEEQVALCKQRFRKTPVRIRSVAEPAQQSQHKPEAFLWAGRVDSNKQPFEYVELARALPEARFLMVGNAAADADSARLWSELVQAEQHVPNLELLPACPRAELLNLMRRAVAVVSTSGYEGMPNTFLEAWARGIPVLALNHDPDGVITRHGLGGCAEGRRDRLVELARALWTDRAAGSDHTARCRAYVENNHSPEAAGAEWTHALNLTSHRSAHRHPVHKATVD
jgi:glycosyltransferase involved in cell wall biosynthesis